MEFDTTNETNPSVNFVGLSQACPLCPKFETLEHKKKQPPRVDNAAQTQGNPAARRADQVYLLPRGHDQGVQQAEPQRPHVRPLPWLHPIVRRGLKLRRGQRGPAQQGGELKGGAVGIPNQHPKDGPQGPVLKGAQHL